jgi:hypothetical protein
MKKWNLLKAIGFIGAMFLIVFGTLGNLIRTVKLAWQRIDRRDEI